MSWAANFDGGSGNLSAYTAPDGTTFTDITVNYALTLASNSLHGTGSLSGWQAYYASNVPAGTDQEIQGLVVVGSGANVAPAMLLRLKTDGTDGIFGNYAGGDHVIRIRSGGSFTLAGSYTGDQPTGGGKTTKMRAIGSASQEYLIDTVSRISTTDGTITAANRTGLGGYYIDGGPTIDDVVCNDVVAATYGILLPQRFHPVLLAM